MKFFSLLMIVGLGVLSSNALAVTISPHLLVNYPFPKIDRGNEPQESISLPSFGIGSLAEWNLFSKLSVETGLYYNSYRYKAFGEDVQLIHLRLPLLLRLNLFSRWSFGLGAYYGRGIGRMRVSENKVNFSDAHFTRNDFGLISSVRYDLPLFTVLEFFTELRGLYATKDIHLIKENHTYLHSIELLGGFHINF